MVRETPRRSIAVLLVTDDYRVREGLRRPLERSGQVNIVATATTRDDVPGLVGNTDPDVVLLDAPAHDRLALELCSTLSSRVPVVVLSTYLMQDEWARVRAAGATAVHLKQIGVGALICKMTEIIDQRGAPGDRM
jgi:two-component system invasion response regulator UvrY